jgi:hypothetical protein
MKIPRLLASVVFVMMAVAAKAQSVPVKNVVLIGIDGLSAEAFQYAQTPVLDSLARQGVVSLKTRGVMPTVSAPNWATVLCGAGPEQHGITSNAWSQQNPAFDPTVRDAAGYFPSLFTLIRQQKPSAFTAMFYDWEWLGTAVNRQYLSQSQYIQGHVMITSVALNCLRRDKPLFTFIYYGLPDETGHSKGFGGNEYLNAIRDIDTEIGKLIAGLAEAGMVKNTLFLITSDHGGVGRGHGGESMTEIEVPWLMAGPGIRRNVLLELPNDLANTAPTLAKVMGLKIPAEWTGRSVNEVFQAKTTPVRTAVYVPKPFCSLPEGTYPGARTVELKTKADRSLLFYTLDGSTPGSGSLRYTAPFTISTNCTLKAVVVTPSGNSQVITRMYSFAQGIKEAKLSREPSVKYAGSGVSGLFDGLIGPSNPASRQWMGFEGDDFEVTIDLGEEKAIPALGLDVLQLPASWIFLPQAVEFSVSANGTDYRLLSTLYPAETDDIRLDGPVMLSRTFDGLRSRYIRIRAVNQGVCPPTHPGAGQKAWLFVSEVEIE